MRTPKTFVRDLALRGYSDERICTVAKNTRWHSSIEEVKEWIKKRAENWRSKRESD